MPPVQSFINSMGVQVAHCHGCAYALTSDQGILIKTPWSVATDDNTLYAYVESHQYTVCPRHQPCEGNYTNTSANCTDTMAMSIHDAWRRSVVKRGRRTAGAPPSVKAACALNAGTPRMLSGKHHILIGNKRNPWPSTAAAVARTVSQSELQGSGNS